MYTYDRRGRGDSGDTKPYAPQREVEDLAAVIEAAGGGVSLISGSAGCVLCLDAATALGDSVRGLYLFEPPFIVNDGRPPMPTATSSTSSRWSRPVIARPRSSTS